MPRVQVYSLDKGGGVRAADGHRRAWAVQYYVRDAAAFDKSHPRGGRDRCSASVSHPAAVRMLRRCGQCRIVGMDMLRHQSSLCPGLAQARGDPHSGKHDVLLFTCVGEVNGVRMRPDLALCCRRGRVETEVEMLHKERLEQRCYSERLNQQTLFRCGPCLIFATALGAMGSCIGGCGPWSAHAVSHCWCRWGQAERARAYPLPSCDTLKSTLAAPGCTDACLALLHDLELSGLILIRKL